MKKLLWCICAAFLGIAAASPCLAADSPWNGTWKENFAKDNLTGMSLSITAKGSGYHFTSGAISYDFACDGKPYTTSGTSTISCKPTSDGGFDFTVSHNGHVTVNEHRSFSADGKLMTMTDTLINADGSTSKAVGLRERKSGTTGLAGEWVNAKITRDDPTVEIFSVDGDMLHIEIPRDKSSLDVKLDGTESARKGPLVGPGETMSYKLTSPNEMDVVRKTDGKVISDSTLTLSADGKTLTLVTWRPGKENEKTTEVFEKQ